MLYSGLLLCVYLPVLVSGLSRSTQAGVKLHARPSSRVSIPQFHLFLGIIRRRRRARRSAMHQSTQAMAVEGSSRDSLSKEDRMVAGFPAGRRWGSPAAECSFLAGAALWLPGSRLQLVAGVAVSLPTYSDVLIITAPCSVEYLNI